MQILMIVAAFGGLIVTLLGIYYWQQMWAGGRKRIIVLCAANSAYHESMIRLLKDGLHSVDTGNAVWDFMMIPNIGNQTASVALISHAITAAPQCIVVIGRTLTQHMKGVLKKRKSTIPTVFVGVQDPDELGLVETLKKPGGCMTGVFVTPPNPEVLGRLIQLLIPFYSLDPSGISPKKASALAAYLRAHHCRPSLCPIDITHDSMLRIESALGQTKAIVSLEGDRVSDASNGAIAKMAEKRGAVYFSGMFSDKITRAPFTYACSFNYLAEEALKLVHEIICKNGNPATMPVVKLDTSRELVVNTTAAERVGIRIDRAAVLSAIKATPALASVKNRVRFIEEDEHEKV